MCKEVMGDYPWLLKLYKQNEYNLDNSNSTTDHANSVMPGLSHRQDRGRTCMVEQEIHPANGNSHHTSNSLHTSPEARLRQPDSRWCVDRELHWHHCTS